MDFTATKVFFNRNIIFLKNFIKEKKASGQITGKASQIIF